MKTKFVLLAVLLLVVTSLCVQENKEQNNLSEPTCDPDWSCTNWTTKCTNSEFTRECTDVNGCGTNGGKPDEIKQCTVETNITSIQFYLVTAKDYDTEQAGMEGLFFRIAPKTEGGTLVKQEGTVNVALWLRVYDKNNLPTKGELIGVWNDTLVHEDDYDYTGASVSVLFDGYTPKSSDYGIIEVTLITPEGAVITQAKDNVLLGRQIFY